MSNHTKSNWPNLLIEGRWRTIRQLTDYWPHYKRHTPNRTFYIKRDNEEITWVLSEMRRGSKEVKEIFRGNLDDCLPRGNISTTT